MALTIIGLLIMGIIAFFLFRKNDEPKKEDYFFSTQGQSDERIKILNLDKASEDASYILDTNKLSFPQVDREEANPEYKADVEREWVINLNLITGTVLGKVDLDKLFDYEWRKNYSSTIYGYSPKENGWTYAMAGDAPDQFNKLQVAVSLLDTFNDTVPNYDPKKLERYIDELNRRTKKYPIKIEIEQQESIENAIEKSKQLVALNQEFNQDAIIVLKADKAFNGKQAWDALLCVGLKWGDGDLFHWNNKNDYGHDQHYSVWTMTSPGYFLPEDVENGQMNPEELVFGFSIPRSADPKNIFDVMITSIKYCQKRLGGTILDKNGQPFNEEKEKRYLIDLIDKMKSKGIEPGSGKALRIF